VHRDHDKDCQYGDARLEVLTGHSELIGSLSRLRHPRHVWGKGARSEGIKDATKRMALHAVLLPKTILELSALDRGDSVPDQEPAGSERLILKTRTRLTGEWE
jgi:hypothetical protein